MTAEMMDDELETTTVVVKAPSKDGLKVYLMVALTALTRVLMMVARMALHLVVTMVGKMDMLMVETKAGCWVDSWVQWLVVLKVELTAGVLVVPKVA